MNNSISLTGYGLAYVNSIKTVDYNGSKFVACKLSALSGSVDKQNKPKYIYFDVTVQDHVAALLQQYENDINNDLSKVIISCKINLKDINAYTGKSGANASLKGSIFKITWIKVNDSVVLHQNSFPKAA